MCSARVEFLLPADPAATERCGQWLGEHLRPGDVVALVGELGAGKTTLVRGLARGLRVDDAEAICSPTYLLVVEHPGPVPLLHADAYLPDKLRGFLDDGGLEYLLDRRSVSVVEWGNLVQNYLPASTLWVEIGLAADGGRAVALRAGAATDFSWIAGGPKMSFRD